MSPVSFSFHQVFMTPEAGYVAPSGCSCVAGEGISFGCANHKSLSPPLLGPQCYVHYWNDMEWQWRVLQRNSWFFVIIIPIPIPLLLLLIIIIIIIIMIMIMIMIIIIIIIIIILFILVMTRNTPFITSPTRWCLVASGCRESLEVGIEIPCYSVDGNKNPRNSLLLMI